MRPYKLPDLDDEGEGEEKEKETSENWNRKRDEDGNGWGDEKGKGPDRKVGGWGGGNEGGSRRRGGQAGRSGDLGGRGGGKGGRTGGWEKSQHASDSGANTDNSGWVASVGATRGEGGGWIVSDAEGWGANGSQGWGADSGGDAGNSGDGEWGIGTQGEEDGRSGNNAMGDQARAEEGAAVEGPEESLSTYARKNVTDEAQKDDPRDGVQPNTSWVKGVGGWGQDVEGGGRGVAGASSGGWESGGWGSATSPSGAAFGHRSPTPEANIAWGSVIQNSPRATSTVDIAHNNPDVDAGMVIADNASHKMLHAPPSAANLPRKPCFDGKVKPCPGHDDTHSPIPPTAPRSFIGASTHPRGFSNTPASPHVNWSSSSDSTKALMSDTAFGDAGRGFGVQKQRGFEGRGRGRGHGFSRGGGGLSCRVTLGGRFPAGGGNECDSVPSVDVGFGKGYPVGNRSGVPFAPGPGTGVNVGVQDDGWGALPRANGGPAPVSNPGQDFDPRPRTFAHPDSPVSDASWSGQRGLPYDKAQAASYLGTISNQHASGSGERLGEDTPMEVDLVESGAQSHSVRVRAFDDGVQ